MRIGVVDLDTSHPLHWIPLEREMGHEVVGVWDGGSVHPPQYMQRFADEQGIPRVYETLSQMAAEVDCAVIHGCDWDTHVAKAQPFVEAGKAVLIDKPMAGKLAHLRQFQRWAGQGTRITGGSSLRFCPEVRNFLARPEAERGVAHTAFVGCGVDEFNYGIHAYAMLCGMLGPGVASVRHLGDRGQRRVQLTWPDGRMGFAVIGAARQWLPFYGTVVTNREVRHLTADVKQLYRALLDEALPYLSGQAEPPLPMDALIAPELCALAARQSWQEGDRPVSLTELRDDGGYDGATFAAQYRLSKYAKGA